MPRVHPAGAYRSPFQSLSCRKYIDRFTFIAGACYVSLCKAIALPGCWWQPATRWTSGGDAATASNVAIWNVANLRQRAVDGLAVPAHRCVAAPRQPADSAGGRGSAAAPTARPARRPGTSEDPARPVRPAGPHPQT
ncbi:hypothetical protein GCM10018787_49780 [Streptomyces thermodiastaticus]|nr:hypothetical protein GCM10018787_49780 [Streptomyces thermodiastaticus]